MAGSLNMVQLIGHLGADPESKSFQNGGEVVNLRIATSESWKDKSTGERQERTQWHQITIWNEPLGNFAKSYLRKGSKVYIQGQLETRKWTDQGGSDRYSTEVVLRPFNSSLISLDKRERDDDDRRGGGEYDQTRGDDRSQGGFGGSGGFGGGSRRPQPAAFDTDLDDHVPFAVSIENEAQARRCL